MDVSHDSPLFSYEAHGLCFSSDFSLKRLRPQSTYEKSSTVEVTLHRGEKLETSEVEAKTCIECCSDFICIRSRFGSVEIGQDTVKLFPSQGTTHQSLFEYYAVYIAAFLLHDRDYLTIHASAVEIDGGTIAFVGPKGVGKSTTASLFYEQGHRLLSDDLIACRPSSTDASPHVDPGFPWMKLGERSLSEVLERSGDKLEWTVPGSSKRIVPIHERQPDSPLPLRHVYVLGYHEESSDQQEVKIRQVGTKQACLVLLSNAFVQMFLEETGADPEHLDRCAALARRIPMSVLSRPQSMDALPSVYHTILDDIRATRPSDSSEDRPQ
ncbi:hypothetical protein [Salinibacter grassmerensis]|uniref:hypothetical protein n=1 Tax=Salinibacter grassmerensis TaxID=3040353 RepID=UPI0021E77680|nr:hypothetical protein [Salinibacter grassmerensis]